MSCVWWLQPPNWPRPGIFLVLSEAARKSQGNASGACAGAPNMGPSGLDRRGVRLFRAAHACWRDSRVTSVAPAAGGCETVLCEETVEARTHAPDSHLPATTASAARRQLPRCARADPPSGDTSITAAWTCVMTRQHGRCGRFPALTALSPEPTAVRRCTCGGREVPCVDSIDV